MPEAIIQTTFTGNDAPFIAAVDRAEKRAATFSGRVKHHFETLFQRTRGARAETALHSLVENFATGNISGGIQTFAARISGLGLAAGVGIGAAIALFEQMKLQVEATDNATKALNKELSRPLGLQSALGEEGLTKEIGSTEKAIDSLQEKRKGFFSRMSEFVERHVSPGAGWGVLSKESIGTQAGRAEASGFERLKDLSEARADAELRVVGIRKVGLETSEREGELQKIYLEADKKRAQLFLDRGLNKPGRSQLDLFKSFAAGQQDERLSVDLANKKADAKQREGDLELRLAGIKSLNFSKDVEALKILDAHVSAAQRNLAAASPDQKSSASAALINAQSALRNKWFDTWRGDQGEGGYDFAGHDVARRLDRENASFNANVSDLAGRQSRGAYNDSSVLSTAGSGSGLESAAEALKDAASSLKAAVTNQ